MYRTADQQIGIKEVEVQVERMSLTHNLKA